MRHARCDYDCIQPWLTPQAHIARQGDRVVRVEPKDSWGEIDARAQIEAGRITPLIPEDEPVFLIRGQDLAAIPAAERWCEVAAELGVDQRLIDEIRAHIELVREWQAEHVAKVPDAPSGVLS